MAPAVSERISVLIVNPPRDDTSRWADGNQKSACVTTKPVTSLSLN
ncbi:MAG: hypothetical protein V3W14_03535 [Candidatus Neomarinimicrobiota bacterium]